MNRRSIVGKNGIGSMLAACMGPPKQLAPTESEKRQALEVQVRALKARVTQLEADLSQARASARALARATHRKRRSNSARIDAQDNRPVQAAESTL